MSDVDTLRVTTAVDVGPIQAGFAQMGSTIKGSTAEMGESFKQLQAQFDAAVAEMQQQMGSMQARIVELETALSSAGRRGGSQMTEARHAVRGLGEEIGIHMPRFVSTYLTSLGPVASIAAAAFTPIAIVGMIEVLGQIPAAITKGINALEGWNEAAKKAFQDSLEELYRFDRALTDHQFAVERAHITGLTGVAKEINEQRILKEEIEATKGKLDDEYAARKRARDLAEGTSGIKGLLGSSEAHDRAVKEQEIADAEIKRLEADLDRLQTKLDVSRFAMPAEIGKQARELAIAQSDAAEKGVASRLETEKKATADEYKLNQISLDEYVAQQKTEAAEELKINLDKIRAKRDQAYREQKETGKPASPALAGLGADEVSAQEKYHQQVTSIETAAGEERKRRQEALNNALVEGEKKYRLAMVTTQEEFTRQEYALHEIDATEETRQFIEEENNRYAAQRKALDAQLSQAQAEGEKKADVVARLNAEILTLEAEHEGKLLTIRTSGRQQETADALERGNEQLSLEEQTGNRRLQIAIQSDNRYLAAHRITLKEWRDAEHEATEQWYTDESNAINRQLALMRQLNQENTKQYRDLANKLIELDQERANKQASIDEQANNKLLKNWQNVINQESRLLTTGLNGWIQGHETFTQSVEQMWNGMVMAVIQQMENLAAQWIEQHLIMAAAKRLFGIQEATTNVAQGTSDAARASVAAFASVMEALPFPANVSAAPGVAAAVFGEGMTIAMMGSVGFAAEGAVLDRDRLMLAHKEEMILPAGISSGLQNLIAAGNGGGTQAGAVHVHAGNNTFIGNESWMKSNARHMESQVIDMVKVAMHRNKLPNIGR